MRVAGRNRVRADLIEDSQAGAIRKARIQRRQSGRCRSDAATVKDAFGRNVALSESPKEEQFVFDSGTAESEPTILIVEAWRLGQLLKFLFKIGQRIQDRIVFVLKNAAMPSIGSRLCDEVD